MTEPLISVLMPVHNGARFINEAVQSILTQRYRNFELLIIDDGSTDDTHSIVTDMSRSDARVRIVRQQKSGIVATLNHSIGLAKGKYLARMDADDIAHPLRLLLQFNKMEAEPQLVACGTDFIKFGGATQYVATPRTNEECKAVLMIESCFAHPTVMMRSDVIQRMCLRYSSDAEYVEDYRLWTELAAYGEFGNIPLALLKYRLHGNQVSTEHAHRQRDAHVKIASTTLGRHGCIVPTSDLREFLWPTDTRMHNAISYFMGSRQLAREINATAPQCNWLHRRTRRIRLRNTVKIATGKSI